MSFHVPDSYRVTTGPLGSPKHSGNQGAFTLQRGEIHFVAIASHGLGWDHVSVHVVGERRCPTWEEMCWVKRRFWSGDDTVIQFHPAKADAINMHPYTLHLWRCTCAPQPIPDPAQI